MSNQTDTQTLLKALKDSLQASKTLLVKSLMFEKTELMPKMKLTFDKVGFHQERENVLIFEKGDKTYFLLIKINEDTPILDMTYFLQEQGAASMLLDFTSVKNSEVLTPYAALQLLEVGQHCTVHTSTAMMAKVVGLQQQIDNESLLKKSYTSFEFYKALKHRKGKEFLGEVIPFGTGVEKRIEHKLAYIAQKEIDALHTKDTDFTLQKRSINEIADYFSWRQKQVVLGQSVPISGPNQERIVLLEKQSKQDFIESYKAFIEQMQAEKKRVEQMDKSFRVATLKDFYHQVPDKPKKQVVFYQHIPLPMKKIKRANFDSDELYVLCKKHSLQKRVFKGDMQFVEGKGKDKTDTKINLSLQALIKANNIFIYQEGKC